MQFHTIVTHENPDLDAILCCYLLKEYGAERYPGVKQAEIIYCPAGRLPEGKTPHELEKEGILSVDIGGGRLDTHPSGNEIEESKKSLSAANLVAEDLKVSQKPSLTNLLEFSRIHDSEGRSISSRNPVDHLLALPNLIKGALIHFDDHHELTKFFFEIFQAVEKAEELLSKPIEPPPSFLLAKNENTVFLPKNADIRSFFCHYLYTHYKSPELQTQIVCELPPMVTFWTQVDSFLHELDLVAKPELGKLLTFIKDLRSNNFLLSSSKEMDRTVSLVHIIKGIYANHRYDLAKTLRLIHTLFDFAIAHELDWQKSISEYQEKKQIYTIGKVKVVAITAERGAVVKVARWQDKADLTIYRDENLKHISICLNRSGRLRNYHLSRLAARLRTAELTVRQQPLPSTEDLYKVGEMASWFLHQSEKLVLHGSPKAHREPSALPFEEIVDLILTEIDRHRKISDTFCPPECCVYRKCNFYPLRLPNCFEHRRRVAEFNVATPKE